jgi:hypothetical protein
MYVVHATLHMYIQKHSNVGVKCAKEDSVELGHAVVISYP